MINLKQIEEYLLKDKWDYEQSSNVIVVYVQGDNFQFNVFIQTDNSGLSFVILPYIKNVIKDCRERIYRVLLQLNFKINYAKFSLDEDNDIALSLELDKEEISFVEFINSLKYILAIANQFYPILNPIACDPNFVVPVSKE